MSFFEKIIKIDKKRGDVMTLEIRLKRKERKFLSEFMKKGTRKARALARANVLFLADRGWDNAAISRAAHVHRQLVWRVKKRYLQEGLQSALEEKSRSGQKRKYDEKHKAEIIALACTTPPKGRKRWSIRLLVDKLKKKKGLRTINRESVRIVLKKKQDETLVKENVVYSENNPSVQKIDV